jgi:hypothetical protein
MKAFKYLGIILTEDHITTEIKQRIVANKKSYGFKKKLTELETPDLMLHI